MEERVALVVLAVMLAAVAYAQQKDTGSQAQAPPVAGEIPLGVTVEESKTVALGYRASKLMGSAVYNEKDERIGKIDDLIVAPDRTVTLAVVDVGGFLGLRKHLVAIPTDQFASVKPKLTLPGATRETLKKLPEFHYAAT
jgi:sporulation protein YlmC with PRC-barrel domain